MDKQQVIGVIDGTISASKLPSGGILLDVKMVADEVDGTTKVEMQLGLKRETAERLYQQLADALYGTGERS